ncbi:MFS transporter [Aureimonas altamirensis]|uniref:MFS transporter n=1 Tax=Aureimonas altamirensis TaxID=370622 RepID=UPI002036B9C3|nr:MFS transporter [Aureimonas altamirensis]MCM2503693.1 MFS transporter [Aureimonas altamirensis]
MTATTGIGRILTILMALTCGVLAANLYYAQPVLSLIGGDFAMPPALESGVVTASQLGYALGLILLVPLGDVVENRKLILTTMAFCVLGCLGLLAAGSLPTLFISMVVIGVTACAAQMIVPLAAHLAPPERRGAVVGNVMAGLLGSILLARPVSSLAAEYLGWRGIFLVSAGLMLVLAALCALALPRRQPPASQPYPALIRSLGHLFRSQPVLRRRALYHAAMFASFAIFWTGAPIVLMSEPYNYSGYAVALFTLSGVFGVCAAPVAGRLADRGYIRTGTIAAMSLAVAALLTACVAGGSMALFILAGILVDLGVQANLVIGQREIFALDDNIRSRLNAVYMAIFFLGGAVGSALTSPVLEAFGWPAVALLGAAFPATALAFVMTEKRSR